MLGVRLFQTAHLSRRTTILHTAFFPQASSSFSSQPQTPPISHPGFRERQCSHDNSTKPVVLANSKAFSKRSEDDENSYQHHPMFMMQSKRRLQASPTLALEAVAISKSVQESVHRLAKDSNIQKKQIKLRSEALLLSRAEEKTCQPEQRNKVGLQSSVTSDYNSECSIAYVCTRFPGTFAANVFVLSEIRRILPRFTPSTVLDFGAGPGTSLMAISRVISSPAFSQHTQAISASSENYVAQCETPKLIKHAWLVDNSPAMKPISDILRSSDQFVDSTDILYTKTLREGPPKAKQYDLVIASYSLSEYTRSTVIANNDNALEEVQNNSDGRQGLRRKAENVRLRRLIRTLWKRTAPKGIFVVIDDGTAAGFEAVSFARELILKTSPDKASSSAVDSELCEVDEQNWTEHARVIAPCLHSHTCPLQGSVTRRRLCRFVQRLNRPLFQRNALSQDSSFEDEYFSFIALQKVVCTNDVSDDIHGQSWGRLIRAPLSRSKHIAIDVCTKDGTLERRVISKRSAPEGQYSKARRAKWGDIWPVTPSGNPSSVNF